MKRTTLSLLEILILAPCLASASPGLAQAPASPPRPGELTFIVSADTHLGALGMEKANRRIIDQMNQLPGKAWPAPLGGRVGTPQGVIVAGDLTNRGTAQQWRLFTSLYGLTGRDGLLRYPVFEGTGNHDRPRQGLPMVLTGVSRRHGGLRYAFTWNGVRFLNLNLYPSRYALAFLQKDLRARPASTPLVIFFHYNLWGPYSSWWSASEKKAFASALAGRNVLALFHGHFHADGHYLWRGHQVYNVGSPRHGINTFCVVRITDAAVDVGGWDWGEGRFTWYHRRPRLSPPLRPRGIQ